MNQKRKYNSRFIYYALIGYVLIFAIWWMRLLYEKNHTSHISDVALLKMQMIANNSATEEGFQNTIAFKDMEKKYHLQKWMIVGEGLVFFIILLIGIRMMAKSWRQELRFARQQRNFMLSITHELKSPIAAIRLVLDTFLKRKNLPADKIQMLSRNASKDVDRLHGLVNNILMAARLDATYQISRGEVDMLDFMQNLIEQMCHKHPMTKFILKVDKPLPTILADHNALTSVATNLIENAVKYCPKESDVTINVKPTENGVLFEVADEGIGIPDSEKPLIFEKFYRIGSEDTRKTKGTGLGLYIVKGLIEAHNGSIAVLDNEPKGTIFQVRMPLG